MSRPQPGATSRATQQKRPREYAAPRGLGLLASPRRSAGAPRVMVVYGEATGADRVDKGFRRRGGRSLHRCTCDAAKRPGRAFRLVATRHGRAFFFACPPSRRTRRMAGWSLSTARPRELCPPARIWPQVCATCISGASETRNPMLLFSFVGLLLRFDACRLLSLLLNDPPRRPRYDPLSSPGHPFTASSPPEHVGPQAVALGVLYVSAPGPHPVGQVGRDAQPVIHLPQQLPIPPVEPPHARRPDPNASEESRAAFGGEDRGGPSTRPGRG